MQRVGAGPIPSDRKRLWSIFRRSGHLFAVENATMQRVGAGFRFHRIGNQLQSSAPVHAFRAGFALDKVAREPPFPSTNALAIALGERPWDFSMMRSNPQFREETSRSR